MGDICNVYDERWEIKNETSRGKNKYFFNFKVHPTN